MGLDDFTDSSSNTRTNIRKKGNKQHKTKNQETENEEDEDPYKVVSAGDGVKKIFPTEDDWKDTLEILEEEMGYSEWEVMNMGASQRHEVLHTAILKRNGSEGGEFSPIKHCIVCDEKFVFPNSWTFVRFKNEAVCRHHEVKEVMEEISEVNSIDGNSWD